jgi:hypothetical protein
MRNSFRRKQLSDRSADTPRLLCLGFPPQAAASRCHRLDGCKATKLLRLLFDQKWPGIGAVVANAAISLADKTPVNLNFTVGRTALQSAIQQGEIRLAISAEPIIKRLQEFPWPKEVDRSSKKTENIRFTASWKSKRGRIRS